MKESSHKRPHIICDSICMKYPEWTSLQRHEVVQCPSWAGGTGDHGERLLLDKWARGFFLQMQECSEAGLRARSPGAVLGLRHRGLHCSARLSTCAGRPQELRGCGVSALRRGMAPPSPALEGGVLALGHQASPNPAVLTPKSLTCTLKWVNCM